MLKEINHTFITLIPKIEIPCRTSHYRPISLCSTFYKTISKILVNRLRPLLDKLVSPFQSAFILGRSIHDNILLTHEIMHKFRKCKGKTAWVALKLDMEKAYDRLEWYFIQKCFQEIGFHPQWIKWVIECISSVSYSFLINGASHGLLLPSRGIRQGDPLSPYIFILCMEVFCSFLIKESRTAKSGIGIKICPKSTKIPYLLFADDCLTFCKSNQQTCSQLKDILDTFCALSGQLVNFHKSVITFSKNITTVQKLSVMGNFNIPQS